MLAMSKKTDPLDDLTVTITDYSTEYSLSDTYTTPYTYSMADATYSYSGSDTITINTSSDPLDLSDVLSFDFKPTIVKVGDTELTEDQLKKVLTILDMFEQDEELSKILKAQMALNKLKD